jgi:hypothetical protein
MREYGDRDSWTIAAAALRGLLAAIDMEHGDRLEVAVRPF